MFLVSCVFPLSSPLSLLSGENLHSRWCHMLSLTKSTSVQGSSWNESTDYILFSLTSLQHIVQLKLFHGYYSKGNWKSMADWLRLSVINFPSLAGPCVMVYWCCSETELIQFSSTFHLNDWYERTEFTNNHHTVYAHSTYYMHIVSLIA